MSDEPARLTPEVALVGDNTLSRVRWTLDRETERLDDAAAEHPEIASMLAANGWTTRMLAWGHLINGLLDLAEFDDELGRSESDGEPT